MKVLTFTWSWSVERPDDFDENDIDAVREAMHQAWMNVTEIDGELTAVEPINDPEAVAWLESHRAAQQDTIL